MAKKYSEDYFEHTKMTFGEHLEELRRSLGMAVASLVVGFIVGLWYGQEVVAYIQSPLKEALGEYYQDKAVQDLALLLAQRDGRDSVTDADLAAARKTIEDDGLLFEYRYFNPADFWPLTKKLVETVDADLAGQIKWPAIKDNASPRKKDLIRLPIYTDVEDDIRVRVVSLGVQEGFVVFIKASLLVGAILSSPLVFYFVWQFVAAGLFPHEKNYVYVFGPFSLLLFLAGAALAYFAVIGLVLDFLFGFNAKMGIDPDPRISEWMSFVMLLPIGFGISFQLPLVMLFLERIGIMSVKTYVDKWRISVLIISILSMILTPADPGSMILMFVPLTILYFGGIGLCYFWPKRKTPFGEEIA